MSAVSRGARGYVACTILAGAIASALTFLHAGTALWAQCLFCAACAVLSSGLKVVLPGIPGNLSVNFVFILLAVIGLGPLEAVVVALASAAAQSTVAVRKRPTVAQIAFNVASSAVCTVLCYWVCHHVESQPIGGAFAVSLLVTASVYFLFNTLSVTGVVALTGGTPFWSTWYRHFFWTAPQYWCGAVLAGLIHLCNAHYGWTYAVLAIPGLFLIHHAYRLYLGRVEQEEKHSKEIADLHLRTIEALALAIDAKDDGTHDHLRRVQVYATAVAQELELPEPETRALCAAALLHDIGKLAVPENILSKPGRLSPEEFEKIKIHPVVGAEILERIQFPYPVATIVRAHHERWDGCGYPDGLRGAEIPLGARILAAVDCLDALASDRRYRRALPLQEAMAELVSQSGQHFDPRVIEVLERRYRELEAEAKMAPEHAARLSTNLRIQNGAAPSAGLDVAPNSFRKADGADFVTSIAAARQEFHLLHEVTRDLGTSLGLEETLSLLGSRLRGMIPYDAIAIYLQHDGRLVPEYLDGPGAHLFATTDISLGDGITGWVAATRQPVLNGDPCLEPTFQAEGRSSALRSAVSVPLEGLSGVIGALTLYHFERFAFTKDHLRMLTTICAKAGSTIENAIEYSQAKAMADTDPLTGLPNARSLFAHVDQEVARARRTKSPLAVLMLDLDGFKQVNDRFGHLHGNKVLQAAAEGVRGLCRGYDYAARMGGDEFVLVLPGISREAARRKSDALAAMVAVISQTLCGDDALAVSIGGACFPDDGASGEQLIAAADKRMYSVKQVHHAQVRGVAPVEELAPLLVQ